MCSDGSVRTLYVVASLNGEKSTWWVKWDVPQAIGFVVVAFDDDISVFYDSGVLFICEYYGAVAVVAEFANGDEGSPF